MSNPERQKVEWWLPGPEEDNEEQLSNRYSFSYTRLESSRNLLHNSMHALNNTYI